MQAQSSVTSRDAAPGGCAWDQTPCDKGGGGPFSPCLGVAWHVPVLTPDQG